MIYGTPTIITSGLVMHVDVANRKSYVSGSITWNDLSGLRNNGSLSGSAGAVPGYSALNGGGLVFGSNTGYVDYGNPATLSVGNTISVFSWFLPNLSLSNYPIVAKEDNSQTAGWELINAAGTLRCKISNQANLTATSTLVSNVWYYAGFTLNSTDFRLYINGVLNNTSTLSSPTANSSAGLWVGSRFVVSNASFFSGNIATTSIYNRSLSAAEVQQNYNALKSRFGLS
jgi:hypothetical protein